jgi:hypothetical protein
MENPIQKSPASLWLPVLAGTAAAAAIAYFLLSEDTAELREKLACNLGETWDSVKDTVMEKVSNGLKSTAL